METVETVETVKTAETVETVDCRDCRGCRDCADCRDCIDCTVIEDLKKYQENIRYGCMDKPARLIIRLFFGFASDLSN